MRRNSGILGQPLADQYGAEASAAAIRAGAAAGGKTVTLFTNGHLALESALEALNLPRGNEVITTPFTFASTTHAIVRSGLVPVFCDINPENYTLDPAEIEKHITERTTAIVPVHVYGNICDVEAIDAISKEHGLKVIYDAAHAFGVKYKGVSSASFGDMSMFSFHATKVFHTIEGGCVCYTDDRWTRALDDAKNYGIRGPEDVESVGGNAKMSEFQAAMGICNLRHLDGEIARRKRAAERYRERLDGVKGIRLNAAQKDLESNYAYFPVVFDGGVSVRDRVFADLRQQGITARKYFYPAGVSRLAKQVEPSARGELEITTLNNMYLELGLLNCDMMGRGFSWMDTGTMDSLLHAASFISMIQNMQGLIVSAPEEVAYRCGMISKEKLIKAAKTYGKSTYGKHLMAVAEGKMLK